MITCLRTGLACDFFQGSVRFLTGSDASDSDPRRGAMLSLLRSSLIRANATRQGLIVRPTCCGLRMQGCKVAWLLRNGRPVCNLLGAQAARSGKQATCRMHPSEYHASIQLNHSSGLPLMTSHTFGHYIAERSHCDRLPWDKTATPFRLFVLEALISEIAFFGWLVL